MRDGGHWQREGAHGSEPGTAGERDARLVFPGINKKTRVTKGQAGASNLQWKVTEGRPQQAGPSLGNTNNGDCGVTEGNGELFGLVRFWKGGVKWWFSSGMYVFLVGGWSGCKLENVRHPEGVRSRWRRFLQGDGF